MPRPVRGSPWFARREEGGPFYAHWYDESERRTKRLSLGATDPVTASARFAAFLTRGPEFMGTPVSKVPTEAVIHAYMENHIRQKAVAVARAEVVARHLTAFFGGRPVSSIDIALCRGYAAHRRAGKIAGRKRLRPAEDGNALTNVQKYAASDATIRKELGLLRAAVNHAVQWRIITEAEKPQIELPPAAEPRPEWLTKEELQTLLGAAKRNWHLHSFIQLAYYTGARRNSIERLTSDQVNLNQGFIDLSLPGEPKTKKRKPVVPIFSEIKTTVETLVAVSEGGPLFGENRNFYMPFHRLAVRCGLERKAHPHVLRHSRATHLLMEGKSIYAVAKLLGDTVSTVERYYGKYATGSLEELLT